MDERLGPWVLLGLGFALLLTPEPGWWLGAGLTTSSLVVLARQRRRDGGASRSPMPSWVPELLCALALLLLTVVMLRGAVLDRLVSHDHTVHFYKAWHLKEHLLGEGRLRGWSNQMFAGYPANYLYPIGADLWVVAVQALTFGLVSLSTAYALAFALFWWLRGYALYRLARCGFGRGTSLLAAVLYMTDEGYFRLGGWVFTVDWGVWPQEFSLTLGMLAVSLLPGVIRGESWRKVGLFGLLAGLSIVSHPAQLIHLFVLAPAVLFALWHAPLAERAGRLAGLGRVALGYLVCGLVASLWLLPFLSFAGETRAFGELWFSGHAVGTRLYYGNLLSGSWQPAVFLAFLGVARLLWSRVFFHTLVGMMCLLLLLTASSSAYTALNLFSLTDAFDYMIFKRFAMLMKPYLFIASAFALVGLVTLTARALRSEDSDPRWPETRQGERALALRIAVVVTLSAPFLQGFVVEALKSRLVTELPQTASERTLNADRRALVAWFREQPPPTPERFYRVALLARQHDHRLADLAAEIDAPIYRSGFSPAFVFRYKLIGLEHMEALSVRYAISKGPPPPESGLRPIRHFGALVVSEFERWRPHPFQIIEGQAEVRVTRFEDEAITLEVAEGASGRLRLGVSPFPYWRATHDGEPIEISAHTSDEDPQAAFMEIPLRGGGRYRLTFEEGAAIPLSWVSFLLGLLLFSLLILADTERRPGPLTRRQLERLVTWLESVEERSPETLERIYIGLIIAAFALLGLLALVGA